MTKKSTKKLLTKIDYGHWTNIGGHDPEDYFGFCYLITNTVSGKKYLGRKYLRHGGLKTKLKDGKRIKSATYGKQTNWKNYTGSSMTLNKEIKELGKDKFKFEIIVWCHTKGGLHYHEQWLLTNEQILHTTLANGEPLWYNDSIPGLKYRPIEFVSEETQKKMISGRSSAVTGKKIEKEQ